MSLCMTPRSLAQFTTRVLPFLSINGAMVLAISSAFFSRSGITSAENGAMSSGSLTSLHIVSITMAALRCMLTLPRTRRPRSSTGTMIDSVGLSTLLTYVVPTRRSRHVSPSVSGLTLAEMTASMRGITSGLSMTEQQLLSATIAVSLMTAFGSLDTSISLTTRSLRTLGRPSSSIDGMISGIWRMTAPGHFCW